jgi:predicted  nucleic acid-binding Zn-ribbon protein
MANFRLVAFNQKGQLVPPASGDIGLVELLAVGTEQSYAVLTKTNLDSLLSLINSQDASALHHHDSIYFTKSELTSVNPANTGASKIIAGNPYGGYASVQTVLDTLYSDVNSLGSLVFEWQNSVVTTSLLAPPLSPLTGDRYLLGLSLASLPSDDWAGFGGHIAEWTGTAWKTTAPSTGMFISADDNSETVYYFNGSDWSEKNFENNTGSGFIDITGGVVSLKNLSEKRIIVGDESGIAAAVDTATLGQVEASIDGLVVKELALFGGAAEYPQGSGLFPDNIADFSITHSKLDNDQPGRLLGFNQNENAVAVDIVGDVTFTVSANQQMTTSIQPLAVKSGMVDWGSGTNQIDDTDIPANNTPVNYTGGATLRAELEGIDSAIGSLQQQNSLQNAEDLTFLKLNGSRAMSGALNMGNQTITNAAEIQVATIKDQVNNAAIDLVQADALRVARKIIFTGGTKKIENLADGTVSTDAANFGQLSAVQTFLISEIAKKLDKAGDTMSGALNMGGNLVRNISDGVLAKDAINLSQLQSSVTQLQNADTANLQTAKDYTDAQVLIEKTRAETAESQLSTSIAQETANRQAAITAEANTRAAEDLTFVKLDGSRAMTGSLSFGGTKKIVQLSNGQDPLDAVNKSQLDAVNTSLTNSINAEISARTSADTALSNRLVVLEADPVTKAYVDTADANLQTQLNNAVSTINTSITSLQQQDQTLAASIQTEQTARISADNALSGRIDSEAATRLSQDTALSQRIAVLETDPVTKTYVDTQDTILQGQITALDTRVTTEITRVDGSISALSQTVTTNYNNQQTTNQSLQTQITQEVSDRTALAARVTTAESDINALEQNMSTAQSDINALEVRATTSESNIQQLQTNVTSLQTQVAGNLASITSINNELNVIDTTLAFHNTRISALEADPVTKTYVDSKDQLLNNRIDFLVSNTDPASLDSLSEIVQAFETADNNINNAITTLANAAATNLQTEVDRATAAENQLRADLSSETTARQNADQLINARIDGVDTSISNLETDVVTVTGNLNNLSSSVTTSLSQINTSITNIQTEVTQLDLDLQAEINRATFAESGLDARVSNLENAPQPVLSVNQKLPGVNGSVLISTDDVP